jgi:hypothetical protein
MLRCHVMERCEHFAVSNLAHVWLVAVDAPKLVIIVMICIKQALYGGEDVTNILKSLVIRKTLNVTASNQILGHKLSNMRKILIVWYTFGDGDRVKIVEESESLSISQYDYGMHLLTQEHHKHGITVLFASYGKVNVTQKIVKAIEKYKELDLTVDAYQFGFSSAHIGEVPVFHLLYRTVDDETKFVSLRHGSRLLITNAAKIHMHSASFHIGLRTVDVKRFVDITPKGISVFVSEETFNCGTGTDQSFFMEVTIDDQRYAISAYPYATVLIHNTFFEQSRSMKELTSNIWKNSSSLLDLTIRFCNKENRK